MKYRKMGSFDWEVSALGFGCMRLPQRRINRLRAETDESVKIIRSGIDQGINYVDTAWPYHLGDSEKILVPCTACNYCMPCPVGVDIPGNFAILNNVSMETSRIMRFMTGRKYKGMESSPRKVDLEKPNGRASLCINCGKCLEKCPQHIQVPDELKKVDAILGKGKKITDYY